MAVWVPVFDQIPGKVGPPPIPISIQIVTEIPSDVRESPEAINRVMDKAMLVSAKGAKGGPGRRSCREPTK